MAGDKIPIGYQLVFQATEAKTEGEARAQAIKVLGNTGLAEVLGEVVCIPGTTVQRVVPGSRGRRWERVEMPSGFRVYASRGLN